MNTALILLISFSLMFGVAILLSRREGSKAAKLEALKKELQRIEKEKERAQKVTDNVTAMSDTDVRNRLHSIANKQQ